MTFPNSEQPKESLEKVTQILKNIENLPSKNQLSEEDRRRMVKDSAFGEAAQKLFGSLKEGLESQDSSSEDLFNAIEKILYDKEIKSILDEIKDYLNNKESVQTDELRYFAGIHLPQKLELIEEQLQDLRKQIKYEAFGDWVAWVQDYLLNFTGPLYNSKGGIPDGGVVNLKEYKNYQMIKRIFLSLNEFFEVYKLGL
jgi:hypothetical protein